MLHFLHSRVSSSMCKSLATLSSSAMASSKVAAPRKLPSDTQIERHRCRFSVSGKGCAELLLELDEIPCCVLTRVLAVDIMFIFSLSSTLCTRGCGGVCVHEVLCVVLVVCVCLCLWGILCVWCGAWCVWCVVVVLSWCCVVCVCCVVVVWWCGVWVLCVGVVWCILVWCGVVCVCLFFSFFSQLSFFSSGTLSFFPLFLCFFSLLFSLLSSLPLSLLSSLLATKHCVKNRSTNTASNFEAFECDLAYGRCTALT